MPVTLFQVAPISPACANRSVPSAPVMLSLTNTFPPGVGVTTAVAVAVGVGDGVGVGIAVVVLVAVAGGVGVPVALTFVATKLSIAFPVVPNPQSEFSYRI